MKFDVIIGNPPYQDDLGKTETQSQGNSSWIYYHFQNAAEKLGNITCLIFPFGGGLIIQRPLVILDEKF